MGCCPMAGGAWGQQRVMGQEEASQEITADIIYTRSEES